MGKEEYELLAEKMREIAEIVGLFPENLQQSVYGELTAVLLDREFNHSGSEVGVIPSTPVSISAEPEVATAIIHKPENTDMVKDRLPNLATFLNGKDPNGDVNMKEFATLVAYFYNKWAFANNMDYAKSSIDRDDFFEALRIVNRTADRPKDAYQTFRNAKNQEKWIEGGKNEGYKIVETGIWYVETKLPKKSGN